MKVVVIDGDTGMTDLLTILLTPNHIEVFPANAAEEGLRLVREKQPDVVILDLSLTNAGTWQVCHALRAFSEVPILIISARDDPNLIAQTLDNGADDFLTKPVSSTTLIARLNKLVRRPHLAPESSSAVDPKQVN